jgi:D-alanyl-lipoteichoic acid acyltransferase DltB (MBOAT superfamily)
MTFNSLEYAAFFATVLALFWLGPRRTRLPLLLAASYVFYASLDWRFLGLLWLSTAVDFLAAIQIATRARRRTRQWILLGAISVHVVILGYFKYFDFFYTSVADFMERTGVTTPDLALSIVLPVGVSFYTFQSMSYTIDVYRGKLAPTHDPILYATFTAFFPQLLAGPIERAGQLMPQLAALRPRVDAIEVREGIDLILLGLFKKVAVADVLNRVLVADAFSDVQTGLFFQNEKEHWLTLLAGCFGLMLQVYCDFSGYSDIARGSAKLLGIDLSRNFLRPFWSTTYRELWQRWHVTLFDWFRDYVYIPLGGNRKGAARSYVNIVIVFTLSGLWHGARGGFVLWGFATGVALVIETVVLQRVQAGRATPDRVAVGTGGRSADATPHRPTRRRNPLGTAAARAYVCTLFALLMMPIIVPDVSQALEVWGGIFTLQSGTVDNGQLVTLLYAAIAVWLCDRHQRTLDRLEDRRIETGDTSVLWPRATLGATVPWHVRDAFLALGVIAFAGAAQEPFFYFQF